jgi:hypothetical protein
MGAVGAAGDDERGDVAATGSPRRHTPAGLSVSAQGVRTRAVQGGIARSAAERDGVNDTQRRRLHWNGQHRPDRLRPQPPPGRAHEAAQAA